MVEAAVVLPPLVAPVVYTIEQEASLSTQSAQHSRLEPWGQAQCRGIPCPAPSAFSGAKGQVAPQRPAATKNRWFGSPARRQAPGLPTAAAIVRCTLRGRRRLGAPMMALISAAAVFLPGQPTATVHLARRSRLQRLPEPRPRPAQPGSTLSSTAFVPLTQRPGRLPSQLPLPRPYRRPAQLVQQPAEPPPVLPFELLAASLPAAPVPAPTLPESKAVVKCQVLYSQDNATSSTERGD